MVSHDKASVYLIPTCLSSSGDTKATKGGIHKSTFSQVISSTADRLLFMLAALLFARTTYLSMEMGGDPLGAAFSLAVYCVFLLSTASILYAQSLQNEGLEEERKRGLYVVIALYCVIGVAFIARVYVILPRPAYSLLMAPCLLPISTALAFYFIRLQILSSTRVDTAVAY